MALACITDEQQQISHALETVMILNIVNKYKLFWRLANNNQQQASCKFVQKDVLSFYWNQI